MSTSQKNTTTPMSLKKVDTDKLIVDDMETTRRNKTCLGYKDQNEKRFLSVKLHKVSLIELTNLQTGRVPEVRVRIGQHPTFDEDGKKSKSFVDAYRKIKTLRVL